MWRQSCDTHASRLPAASSQAAVFAIVLCAWIIASCLLLCMLGLSEHISSSPCTSECFDLCVWLWQVPVNSSRVVTVQVEALEKKLTTATARIAQMEREAGADLATLKVLNAFCCPCFDHVSIKLDIFYLYRLPQLTSIIQAAVVFSVITVCPAAMAFDTVAECYVCVIAASPCPACISSRPCLPQFCCDVRTCLFLSSFAPVTCVLSCICFE